MFNAKKSSVAPSSLISKKRYDNQDVIDQLHLDFEDKCYICGDKTNKDLRVEHFVPHNGDENIKFDWENLFLSCDYCNNIKSDTYNKPGKEIVNSVKEKIEDLISHDVDSFPILDISFHSNLKSIKVTNTIELLEKVYFGKSNSSAAQIRKKEDLIKNLRREIGDFLISIHEYLYLNGKHEKEYYKSKINDHLSDSSCFIEFKRSYLKANPNLLKLIK